MSDDRARERERIRRLEFTLTGGFQTQLSNPNSDAQPLAARLARENIHVTQVKVTIGESAANQMATETRDYERWAELLKTVHRHVKWHDFRVACATKVDVSIGNKWMAEIADATGNPLWRMRVFQQLDSVPTEWLDKVYKLPDWTPPAGYRRNNFSMIAVELVAALKSAGKSNLWIASTLTNFLRDFNGPSVERADVTTTPPP